VPPVGSLARCKPPDDVAPPTAASPTNRRLVIACDTPGPAHQLPVRTFAVLQDAPIASHLRGHPAIGGSWPRMRPRSKRMSLRV